MPTFHTFSAFAAYDTAGINFESPHGAVALHAVPAYWPCAQVEQAWQLPPLR